MRLHRDRVFTQEDPIGLAGGLNLYGYAGGDPVNFSDPFGLSAECKGLWGCIKEFLAYEWRGFQAGADPTRVSFNFEEEGQFGALLGRASLAAAGAGRITTGTAGTAGSSSQVLLRSQRGLQKFFTKHGSDFGLSGNWNPGMAAEASRAIHQHINSAGVRAIQGTYRGNAAVHYLDANTGLNIIVDPAGNFVSGWRLGADQMRSVLTSGRLY